MPQTRGLRQQRLYHFGGYAFQAPKSAGTVPQAPLPAAVTVHGGDQPGSVSAAGKGRRLRCHRQGLGIIGADILEEQLHTASADHADVSDLPRGEVIGLEAGALFPAQLRRQLSSPVFHRPAAYGTHRDAVFCHQHLGPRSPGSGALTGNNAAQHGSTAGGKGTAQCGKNLLHRKTPPFLCYLYIFIQFH